MNGQAKQGQLRVIYFQGTKTQSKLMLNSYGKMSRFTHYKLGGLKFLLTGGLYNFGRQDQEQPDLCFSTMLKVPR